MTRFIQLSVFLLLFVFHLSAQRADENIANYTAAYPAEQAYLHIDNNLYNSGDTVWFKAYVLANAQPTTFSTNLYADWYDTSGKLLAHQTYPIQQGGCYGQFLIPGSYPGNKIQLLAYTKWMLNSDNDFLFHKTIDVIPIKALPRQEPEAVKTMIQFFPEGGNLIAGIPNKVAFKATDQFGAPISVTGKVKDVNGNTITNFTSEHDGMGYFYITPATGVSYIAEYGASAPASLPAVQPSGIAMEVALADSNRRVTIRKKDNGIGNLNFIHLLATSSGTVVYLSNINLSTKDSITSNVPVSTLPSGVVTFTVLDSSWNPLAERISFVKNQDITTDIPTLSIEKKNLTKKGLNTVSLKNTDSVEANLSVSIIDAGLASDNKSDIVSYLLLTGQLKGKVDNPAYYFQDSTMRRQQELDLVMLTNGWRKYNWHAIATGGVAAIKFQRDSAYFFLHGNIVNKSDKLPQQISFMAKGVGLFGLYSFPIKKDGSFADSTMFIYDTARFAYRPEKHQGDLEFKYGVLPEAVYKTYPFTTQSGVSSVGQSMPTALPEFYKSTLPDVVVTTAIKRYDNPIDSIEEEYESLAFKSAVARKSAYVLDDPILASYGTDFKGLILAKMSINLDLPQYKFMQFMVNEQSMPKDAALQTVPMDVVFMKYYKYLVTAPSAGGGSGVISIYTKRGFEKIKEDPNTPSTKIFGYTVSEEFYSPDYSTEKNDGSITDHRKTLYWNPQVSLSNKDSKDIKLSFYNNDFANRLRVIVEGIKADGTPIHIEKIIE